MSEPALLKDEKGKIETLNGFIQNDQSYIKWGIISSIGLFVIGVCTSVGIYLVSQSQSQTSGEFVKLISAIPGLSGTLVSGIVAKIYFDKKNRIISCKLFRDAYASPPVSEKIDERFWKLVDESLK